MAWLVSQLFILAGLFFGIALLVISIAICGGVIYAAVEALRKLGDRFNGK